jgi:crotonobetainyl-CoA:carnitine CoA-transferase CaiB-like acyl-CoA transferase
LTDRSRQRGNNMSGCLAGFRVLDLSRLLPGPYCSMLLADHGAEVISIEDQRFKADALFFESLYRNKRHLSLNLKHAEGKEIFFRLAETSDVIIEGFRPGVANRLGVDYQTIHERFPGIVYCSISGYGQTGPWRDKAGHDINYLATAGILDLIGPAQGPPSIPGIQIADIGGSMNGVIGILLALIARNRTGTGQYIDISMTDSLLGFLSLPHYFYSCSGKPPQRSDELLSHRYGCYNTYATSDGSYMAVGALEHRFWQRLCISIGLDEYIDCQFDDERREEIIAALRRVFLQKSGAQWERHFGDDDVCCTRIITLEEMDQHPLFKAREMFVDRDQHDSAISKALGISIKISDTPGAIRTAPAHFGQHNEEILSGLGYSEAQVDDLRARNII